MFPLSSSLEKILPPSMLSTSRSRGLKRTKEEELIKDIDEMMDSILPLCLSRPNVYFQLSETLSKWIMAIEQIDDRSDLETILSSIQTDDENSIYSMLNDINNTVRPHQIDYNGKDSFEPLSLRSKAQSHHVKRRKSLERFLMLSTTYLEGEDNDSSYSENRKSQQLQKQLKDFVSPTDSTDGVLSFCQIADYFNTEEDEREKRHQRDLEKAERQKQRKNQEYYLEKEHEELTEVYESLKKSKKRLSMDFLINDNAVEKKFCDEDDGDCVTTVGCSSCNGSFSSNMSCSSSEYLMRDESSSGIKSLIFTNLPTFLRRYSSTYSTSGSKGGEAKKHNNFYADNKHNNNKKNDALSMNNRMISLNEKCMKNLVTELKSRRTTMSSTNKNSIKTIKEMNKDVQFLRYNLRQKIRSSRRIRDTINSLIQQLESDIRIYYMIREKKENFQKEWKNTYGKKDLLFLQLLDYIEERMDLIVKRQQQKSSNDGDNAYDYCYYPYARVYNLILDQYLHCCKENNEQSNQYYRSKRFTERPSPTSESFWRDVELLEELVTTIIASYENEKNTNNNGDASTDSVITTLESIRENIITEAQQIKHLERQINKERKKVY